MGAFAGLGWQFRPMGEAALLVEATPADAQANQATLALAQALAAAALPGVVSALPSINSVLIQFDPLRTAARAIQAAARELLPTLTPSHATTAATIEIPVSYGGADGPDLDAVAAQLGLEPRTVVALHCAPLYRVLAIGFAPGFPYLGPLPPTLHLPRRATPRTAVPAGSVAIAATFSGIYPAVLPGGWHLLGRTTLTLFDPHADPPALLAPGAGVRFVPQPSGVLP